LPDSEARDAIYLQEIETVIGAARAPLQGDDYQEIAEFASAMDMKYKPFGASARGNVACTILNTLFGASHLPSSK